jgi:hypothetical protein
MTLMSADSKYEIKMKDYLKNRIETWPNNKSDKPYGLPTYFKQPSFTAGLFKASATKSFKHVWGKVSDCRHNRGSLAPVRCVPATASNQDALPVPRYLRPG